VIGTIQAARPSKSGKTLSIQIDGTWYQSKLWQLQQAIGRKIAAETSESDYNGQKVRWLNTFSFADADPQTQAPVPAVAAPAAPGATISPAPVSHYQPMCSNLAAALIAAGRQPEELAVWFNTAKELLEGRERMPGDDDLGPPY